MRARRVVERVVRLERDVDGAVVALGDQVEAVVEELAEQREPAVVGGRQPLVGRHVREDDGGPLHHHAMAAEDRVEGRLRRWLCVRRGGLGRVVGRPDLGEGRGQLRAGEAGIGEGGIDGRRVLQRLVDDQVRDDARIRVHDRAAPKALGARRGRAHLGIVAVGEDHLARAAGAEGDAVDPPRSGRPGR